ncbi:uncharacterized protein L201_005084 [Kwoniella dendrophila CBS 6074]|uniref:Csf1 N-terminal domain-containing protein n=1 Tax=Kwoniella dendrophila CBS 6074 TaxID=1295534 RepID=A0AAX4JXI8_9TREE
MAISDKVNLLLLIELAAVVIGASAFLYYWNRLLGSVVAFLIRLYTWKNHNAHIVIGSLQIAPLAGRISFRDVEYHSSNISVRALHGHVTWRYWKLRIRHETDTESTNPKRYKLPCRITIFAEGVEGFVFNRTPAYDAIVERMKKHEREENAAKDSPGTSDDTSNDPESTLRSRLKKVAKTSTRGSATTKAATSENGYSDQQPDHHNVNLVKPAVKAPPEGLNWFREALPIDVRIVTGSLVLGSDATPMVLIGDFKRAEGTLEVSDSRSTLDLYKMAINLTFHSASVLMRTNVDYSGPLLAHGKKVYDELLKQQPDLTEKPPSALSVFTGFHLLSKQFKFLRDPKFSTPPVAGLPTDKIWKGLARYREPEMGENKAPKREEREYAKVTTLLETHRLDLTYYADTPGLVPHSSESPYIDELDQIGNVDLPPEYGIDIVIHKGNIRYGPWADKQREPSKDWQFDNAPTDVERRYGWLDVVVGPNSSISYTQDQVATKQGYDSMLVLQLDSIGISSSLSMTMPTPLEWDAQRDWGMDVTLDTPSISLLRDHVTLISDLAKDWSSGASVGDYHHFVPNHYNFRVSLINYDLHLYINDYNIVDAPWSRDANAVASTQYRPESATVPFSVSLSDARVELCVPKWDTHRAFGSAVTEIGKIGEITAKGSYLYYSVPKPDHQETLNLHLEGKHVVFKALGWVLRRLFCVKDNYFGGFTQFRTMQEYLEKFDHDPTSVGDPIEEKYRPGRSDPFAVFVTMNVEESFILMSDEIYNCKRGLVQPVPQLQMNLKSVDHFMELSLDATPTYVVASSDLDSIYAKGSCPSITENDIIFIEGIEVKANRLFGPQPHANTYLCLWEVSLPKISAFLSPDLISVLQATGRSFGYTFPDVENGPSEIYVPKAFPDGNHAISVEAPSGFSLDTSSMGTRSYSSMMGVLLPSLTVNILERGPRSNWHTVGSAQAGCTIDIYKLPTGWKEAVAKQQEYLKREDQDTSRIWYMYQESKPLSEKHVNGLYLPQLLRENSKDDEPAQKDSDFPTITSDITDIETSSASSSDSEVLYDDFNQMRLRNRRSRSFATARETPDDSSVGDESDTVSSVTSIEGSVQSDNAASYQDIASAMSAKLRSFHMVNSKYGIFPIINPASSTQTNDKALPTSRSIQHGTLIRLSGSSINVNLVPSSATAISAILTGLSTKDEGFEKRLDELVASQLSSIEQESTIDDPTVLDLKLPSINLQLSSGLRQADSITTSIQEINCHLSHYAPRNKQAITDIIAKLSTISITGTAPTSPISDISLREVAELNVTEPGGVPMFKAAMEDFEIAVHSSQGIRIHAKTAKTRFDAVTPAIETIRTLTQPWQKAITHIQTRKPLAVSDAHVLYTILQKAIVHGYHDNSPAFGSEAGYGLHVPDARNIRWQSGWWILARFREWYRRLPVEQTIQEELQLDQMANYIMTQLGRIDEVHGAPSVIRQQHFMKTVFGPHILEPLDVENKKKETALDLFIYSENLKISHYGYMLGSRNIASSSITVNKASIGGSETTGKADDNPVTQYQAVIAIQEVQCEMKDSLIGLVKTGLEYMPEITNKQDPEIPSSSDRNLVIILDGQVGNVDVNVSGGGLRLHYGIEGLHLTRLSRQSSRQTHKSSKETLTATCRIMELSLLQTEDNQDQYDRSADRIIVSLRTEALNALFNNRHTTRKAQLPGSKLVLGLKLVEFDSRPQLRAFYAFVQTWKAKELPLYTSAINDVQSRLTAKMPSKSSLKPAPSTPIAAIDFTVKALHVQIRAAKALWLRWDIGKIYASHQGVKDNIRFAVQVEPQVVGAYASLRKHKSTDSSSLRLPSITIIGNTESIADRNHLNANVQLGFFTGILKPVILDRLLSLHQQLAADITQFATDWKHDATKILNKRHAKGISMISIESTASAQAKSQSRLFNIHIGVAGLRLGLRADDVATTLLFEALAVEGRATNHLTEDHALRWRAKIDHFGLSLGHLGSQALSNDSEPVRTHRTAYMVLDAEVQEVPPTSQTTSKLNVNLSRVHTVMHPEALSELADLLKSWMSDLHTLRDHRSAEVAEVKVHTTKVLKRLESAEKVEHSEKSWFANRLVFVEVSGIGIAIPLVEGAAIGDSIRSDTPALLYSIRVISFQNRRNETARFKVQNMALQFIKKFDQSSSEHFTGDFHESLNRMTLPSIDMEAQMSSTPDLWQLSAHCSATDFKLSLSPDITDGIFKLIDLFHHGKERISKLEEQYKSEMAKHPYESVSAKYDDPASPMTIRPSQRILVRMSYTFNSGIVELHRGLSESDRRTMNADLKKSRQWHDTVVLPTVSIWMDYTGPKAIGKANSDDTEDNDALLLFNAAVHESRNLLRPSILPFFIQILNRMETRAKVKMAEAYSAPHPPRPEPTIASTSEQSIHSVSKTPMERIRIRLTLRIDKSRLRLSCAPDSNAYADLKWESGGFLASTTIGGNDNTTVAGTISGVTAYLRHEFAEEGRSCIEAGAKDMAFSVAYSPDDGHGRQKGLSVVVDTSLSGQFRLEQFSAWLIFASVWIDSTPSLDLPPKSAIVEAATNSTIPTLAPPPYSSSTTVSTSNQDQQKLAIVALIRFRSIDFDANVGVTNAKLELTPIVIRTLSNGESTEIDLDIGLTQLTAKGDISGTLRSEHLNLHTSRQSSRSAAKALPKSLNMMIDAGNLTGDLMLQDLKVIMFQLEPAVVRLSDDWEAFNKDPNSPIELSFTVKTGVFRALARLLAIPSLLNKVYSITNTFDSQERVASHRSNIYKKSKLRKSSEPSPMAAAIMHTARKTGHSTNNDKSISNNDSGVATITGNDSDNNHNNNIRISQTMKFELAGIELGLFNAPITDENRGDYYSFQIGKCQSDLSKSTTNTKDNLPLRNLKLLVSSVRWDTADGPKAARDSAGIKSIKEILESALKHGKREIASVPEMHMTMISEEETRTKPRILLHDFDLVWGEGYGDIAILPYFFEQAYKTLDAFLRGLDQEQITKTKRRGMDGEKQPIRRNTSVIDFNINGNVNGNNLTNNKTKTTTENHDHHDRINGNSGNNKHAKIDDHHNNKDIEQENSDNINEYDADQLIFKPKYQRQNPLPVPKIKFLGEATRQALDLVPKVDQFSGQLPIIIHKGITSPLEDGMDLLLKIYQKQLPDRTT